MRRVNTLRSSISALLTVGVLVVGASRAEAVVLVAPIDNVPVPTAGFFGGVELASSYEQFHTSLWDASFATAVYRSPGGTIDFYYQIHNNSDDPAQGGTTAGLADSLHRSTHADFTGFTTDVFNIDPFTGGSNIGCAACPTGTFKDGLEDADLADRETENTVGFDFGPDAESIDPGDITLVYVIRTNATDYTEGEGAMINGTSRNPRQFQPAAGPVVPEPAMMTLFVLGLLGSASGLRRRQKAASRS